MLDDERMSHIGNSFSAVCSPPISMMYKGRKRSSSKLKKMEVVDDNDGALDEDIWAGLLKISKSSEELWKDVYAVFSPPTPIGAKAPEYSPFDPYKPGGAAAPRGLPTLPEQPETSPGNVDTTASTAEPGKTPSNVATPFVPTVPEKTTPSTNGTITHSISIAQVPQSTGKAADSTDDRRSNRKSRDQNPFMSMAGKKPSAKSITANPFNIRSLLDREDGRSRALPPQHTPQTQLHPTDMHEPTHTPFANSMNISIPMHTSPVVPHLHPHSSHHNPTMDPMDTSGHRNHPAYESRPMNGLSHINTPHHSQPIYIHSPAPMYNIESPLLPCTEPNHNDPRNCNCNTSGHSTYTHPSNINVSGYNNTTSNANANSSNNTPTTGNNEKWTEVILYCSKLTTLASSGLANNLTFAQLTDGISLARQITTATGAAILNSSSYPPFQSTSVSDELNRLVAENLGPISTPNSQSSTVQISPHPDSSHLTPRGTTFPYYSTPPINSLPSPSITYSNSAPPSAFSSPTTFSTPPYSPSSTPINSGTLPLSSWGNDGAFSTFVELRRKLPVPSPRSESGEESPDQPSSPRSPPLALSVVPLSPCLSPGGSSATVPPVSSESSVRDSKGKEPKEKEEKGTWRKPRGKKRQKYEADLECRSCGVRQTPEWRRGPFGAKTLCNACGLHWAKVLKAEGKGDQKRVALLEAKRTQFMMTQKRGTKSGIGGLPSASGNPGQIKSEPLYLSPHITQ